MPADATEPIEPTPLTALTGPTRADAPPAPRDRPDNVVVVLLDSLNRHHLGCYGGDEFETPEPRPVRPHAGHPVRPARDRIAAVHAGPPRHPLRRARLPVEAVGVRSSCGRSRSPAPCEQAGVTSMLVTDHPHLFETGGENYHTDFFGWEYLRGHEGDPWRTCPDPSWVGTPARPAVRAAGGGSGSSARAGRADGPGLRPGPHLVPGRGGLPRSARRWRRRPSGCAGRRPHHDRWLLFVDEFDPHEPFDTPEPWTGRYDDEPWEGDDLIWPPYADGAIVDGQLDDAEGRHIRANYGAKLSMIDHWFGRVLDALDEQDLWDSTAVVVCTDHGHYLGEERVGRDIWGKPAVPAVRAARSHAAAGPLARPSRRRHASTRSRRTSTCTRRCATCSACPPSIAPTASRSCRSSPATPTRCASGRSAASTATGCRSPTARTSTPAPRRATASRWPCGRTGGRRCRSTVSACPLLPKPDDRATLDLHAGLDGAGDAPAVPGRRHAPPVRQQRADRRRPPPLRPRRRPRRAGEPARRTGREGLGRPPARGAGLGRGPRRAAHAAWPWTEPTSANGPPSDAADCRRPRGRKVRTGDSWADGTRAVTDRPRRSLRRRRRRIGSERPRRRQPPRRRGLAGGGARGDADARWCGPLEPS